jgi:magnesium-transporting ATPase (P-type)
MLTGDSETTASKIAKESGIILAETKKQEESQIITGTQWDLMSV